MKRIVSLIGAGGLALLAASSTQADVVVFSQPTPTWNGNGGYSQWNVQAIGDNFTLTSANTITGVRWWGAYDSGPKTDTFTVEFYVNNGGLPAATPFSSQTGLTVTRSGSGLYQYEAALSAPLALNASTPYYISIINAYGTGWVWARATDAGTDPHYGRTLYSGSDHSWWAGTGDPYLGNMGFELEAVPEPSQYAAMGLILLGVAGYVFRRYQLIRAV